MHTRKGLAALLAAGTLALGATGCAKTWDQMNRDGSIIGSTKAPYIVVKQSGGVITDVYKLPSAIVQSETGSDGWLFVDQRGDPINMGGDMKSIRLDSKNDPRWDCYHEYHMELEAQSYQELYGQAPEQCRK